MLERFIVQPLRSFERRPTFSTSSQPKECMSELRFTCPACGQHMQCEKAYVGDKTACPNCQAELRIPFSHTPIEPKTQLPRAELVSAPAEPSLASNDHPSFGLTEAAVPISAAPKSTGPVPHVESQTCICPVCQSELRIIERTAPSDEPRIAQLVRTGAQTTRENEAPNSKPNEPSKNAVREDEIAAAREAHPVSLYPSIKPRLAYILSGGKAVSPESSANSNSEPHQSENHPPPQSHAE